MSIHHLSNNTWPIVGTDNYIVMHFLSYKQVEHDLPDDYLCSSHRQSQS